MTQPQLYLITKQNKKIKLELITIDINTNLTTQAPSGLKWWVSVSMVYNEFLKVQQQWKDLIQENNPDLMVDLEYHPKIPNNEGKLFTITGRAAISGISYHNYKENQPSTASITFNGMGSELTYKEVKTEE